MSDAYVSFTVQAQRCCPGIIAVSHVLYYHRHRIGDEMNHHLEELAIHMRDLNAAYAAALAQYQNATSGAPPAESLSEPDTKA